MFCYVKTNYIYERSFSFVLMEIYFGLIDYKALRYKRVLSLSIQDNTCIDVRVFKNLKFAKSFRNIGQAIMT